MDALTALLTRRSVRRFDARPVTDEELETLLRAAMQAPSAGNQQPWAFMTFRARETLEAISRVHPYASMLPTASVAVLVCGDLAREKHVGYWVEDCAAAMQNLLLAAHAQGLGAVWLGVHPRQDRVDAVARLLGLPTGIVPFGLAAVGRPAENKEPAARYDPARVHREHW